MPPTIIVGDDESPAEVAARLNRIATNQRHVKVRSDLRRPAFDVADYVYAEYIGDRERSVEEQRENAVAEHHAAGAAEDALTGDDTPDGAVNADPATLDEGLAEVTGDATPQSAVNADLSPPPADPDPEAEPEGDDQGDDGEAKPKPRKRAAPRKATPRKAAKSTPPAAGAAE